MTKGIGFWVVLVGLFLPAVSGLAREEDVSLPEQPTENSDPGSAAYRYESVEQTIDFEGRDVTFFAPKKDNYDQKLPVIVFGHGHAVPLFAYRATFEHLARKGVAVIYPSYDTGWGDKDFERMGRDWVKQVAFALKHYAVIVDSTKLIYAGHSNGAWVALIAAGLTDHPLLVKPKAMVLFATAGDADVAVKKLDPSTILTLVVGDRDDKTPASFTEEVFNAATVRKKQMILMTSYTQTSPEVLADHGFVRTYDWGGARLTPLHYYGSWKYLLGAAWDADAGSRGTNPYVYGDKAASTGIDGMSHRVVRARVRLERQTGRADRSGR